MSDKKPIENSGKELEEPDIEILNNDDIPTDDQNEISTETLKKSEKSFRTDGKYKHRDEHELNGYNKKLILQYMIDNGSNSEICDEIAERFKKLSSTIIEEYINQRAAESQQQVTEEIKTEIFQSMNEWTTAFKENKYDVQCGNELSLIFKVIAESEKHPKPKEASGINFKQLYKTLSNLMSGNPSPELDKPTKQFLAETFEELMQEINSPEGVSCMLNIASSFKDKPTVVLIGDENASNQNNGSFMKGLNPLQLPCSSFEEKADN